MSRDISAPTNHKVWPPNRNLSKWIQGQFEPGYAGYGIDVGASDGISINTTYELEIDNRWTIVSVEANPDFGPLLKRYRARVEMCACADQSGEATFSVNTVNPEAFSSLRPQFREDLCPSDGVSFKTVAVSVKTVDQIIAAWEFPRLDVLCVDTEGTELDVLKGCDLARWKPRVIVTECWDKVGPIDPYLEAFGYARRARNVHNDVFVLAKE
jgi:FkbM family methyltransferase